MDRSILVRLFGFPATLVHGDPLVLDRWRWLKARLPVTRNSEKLIDIGCGSGAFSIGAARRGYVTLGLSWDERNQRVAGERARLCKAVSTRFEILDVRRLDTRDDLVGRFDVAICCENIEHVIDDRKLMKDIAACLKPGGRLLLTTPHLFYRPITAEDQGPFVEIEQGGHVRRGYTESMLEELCEHANLTAERFSYCSGFVTQKVTFVERILSKAHPLLGWLVVLPLRIAPLLLDGVVTRLLGWPHFCICLEAYKPRYEDIPARRRQSASVSAT